MEREVDFSDVETVLSTLEYPVGSNEASSEFAKVTVRLADGEVNLGSIIEATSSDHFDSVADLHAELHNTLPRGSVGEPYQSEGEG